MLERRRLVEEERIVLEVVEIGRTLERRDQHPIERKRQNDREENADEPQDDGSKPPRGSHASQITRPRHGINVARIASVHTMAKKNKTSGAKLGFEATLWQAADKLRNNMDAAEYKHVVLGLIFLKYISDAFQERGSQILLESADPNGQWFIRDAPDRDELLEDRDEYASHN